MIRRKKGGVWPFRISPHRGGQLKCSCREFVCAMGHRISANCTRNSTRKHWWILCPNRSLKPSGVEFLKSKGWITFLSTTRFLLWALSLTLEWTTVPTPKSFRHFKCWALWKCWTHCMHEVLPHAALCRRQGNLLASLPAIKREFREDCVYQGLQMISHRILINWFVSTRYRLNHLISLNHYRAPKSQLKLDGCMPFEKQEQNNNQTIKIE